MRYGLNGLCWFWLLLLCLFSFTARAQEYSYARYDVKDGLAGSVVYSGVEDKEGFLWFSTETGVSRFDGTHFRNFTKADGLPDNEILKLFVDSKGRVWMMPFRSSICYYWKGKIYNQQNDSLLKRLPVSGQILSIVEDKQGNLMIMDSRALYFISTEQEIKVLKEIDKIGILTVNAGLASSGNFTAIIQVGRYDAFIIDFSARATEIGRKDFCLMPVLYHSTYLSPDLDIFRHQDSLLFTAGPGQIKKSFAIPARFNSISVINDMLCSINTGNGAVFYDVKGNKSIRRVLRGKTINAVFQDSEGSFWFLTAGEGIFRIGSFEFSNFIFSDNNKVALSVFSINKIDSLLYIGSEKSLLFTIDSKSLKVRPHYIFKDTLNTRILSIVQFSSSRIILGTDDGVVEFGKSEKRSSQGIAVKSIHVDEDRLLVSMQHGIFSLLSDLTDTDYRFTVRSTSSYVQDKVYYSGTVNGLYALDSTGNTIWLGEQNALLQNRISDIEGTSDSTLWIATHGDGVIGYKAGKVICSIRQRDGLTSDICRNVFIAGNDVWVGTDKGLNRIQWHGASYKITTFTSADGLIADIINAIHIEGSQAYIGTPAGLTSFDADKISLNSYCKLRTTGIQMPGKGWFYDTAGFTLPPSENAIRFEYVGISYRSAGDITYRYRLAGLNDTWQTTRETFLSYPSLPSGDYELQLVATNKFGVESDMVRIPFQVEKLLWEKTWFRLLILVIVGALIWLFVNARIRKLRRQNDEKMQINNRMAELEQMALKAQMNPHFIFNSLNSVQQYVIDKDLLGANKFITEFSRLIRLTLDISSKTKVSIYEEISYITTYLELEKTKFEDKFSYSVILAPDLNPSDWFIPPMILQPYVENSIRHGVRLRKDNKGEIAVTISKEGGYLVCVVQDNGVGRALAARYKSQMPIEYQSKGMTLTARRIDMLNNNQVNPVLIEIKDLYLEEEPAGTRVSIRFPVEQAQR